MDAATQSTVPSVRGIQVGVLGLGVAGAAMARLLAGLGAHLVLADRDPSVARRLGPSIPHATWRLGDVAADVFAGCAWVFVSPGVPPLHPALAAARLRGTPILGEVELIALAKPAAKTLAITGTNGKSTTTSLAGAILRALGAKTFVGGNLGDAIGDWLSDAHGPQGAVLELSSYQIDGLVHHAPDVAVVLNVTPDHLARYKTLAAYAHSKGRLVAALKPSGTAVLNADDPRVVAMATEHPGEVLWLTTTQQLAPGQSGLVVREGRAVPVGRATQMLGSLELAHPRLLGAHNQQNTLAALLAAAAFAPCLGLNRPLGGSEVHAAYLAYPGLPHRLATVAVVAGVRYLNDSKATNDASAATAVLAMDGPFVLLVGGQDKGGGYQALREALQRKPAKAIIAFGEARDILHAALIGLGTSITLAPALENACEQGRRLCSAGDTLLLSPACTSFDAFDNYQHRGETFAAWVHAQA